MRDSGKKFWFRVVSGLLSVTAFVVVAFRIHAVYILESPSQTDPLFDILRIIFPLSLAFIFGYVALKGRFFGD